MEGLLEPVCSFMFISKNNQLIIILSFSKTEIGVGLAGMGVAFLFLGVLLLFDKGLLAIGNVSIFFYVSCYFLLIVFPILQLLFLSGLAFLIGLERTFFFFFQRHKIKGSAAFFSGIVVVFLGWPLVGMCIELYGFILLFG
jgi:hypothetical protein